ncbi:MAG: Na/Pi cotransporter family protein [Kiritimatiellae bacterium]|nr:Na/Pi cotransporter family protein [Kiritimatiellia bacterium]MDD4735930.1 Na/Pi cotransporter family protein [Kiritimatiellia bacterium]
MIEQQYILLVFEILGGLALFIFGMHIMTEGLRNAAGNRLRSILAGATRNGISGITLGTSLGFLVQSSAATVMLVGFINAGLMTLTQSVPVMLGANVGTTISMQLISFKLGAYCFVAITLGFIIQMTAPKPGGKAAGKALMGFGLLFLGMNIMSEAIKPYREVLAPMLAHVDGRTLSGTLMGIAAATLITGIIQSSGATIGMVFAMIHAGIITDLSGAYPVILGANIGTCMTAILGCIGTNIEARRSAASHLFFNLYSAAFGVLTAPLIYRFMPMLSNDLVHQAANANTIKMAASALVILPIYPLYARTVRLLTPSRTAPPEPSFLDDSLYAMPEQAIAASILELRRVARLCMQSLRCTQEIFTDPERKKIQRIRLNEESIDTVKLAVNDYLAGMTSHYLSKRQSILIQHINRCMANLERIGDHIERMCELTEARAKVPQARFEDDVLGRIFALFSAAERVLSLVIDSLDPERKDFQEMAQSILSARDNYMRLSLECKSLFNDKIASRGVGMAPLAGIYLTQFIDALDRIVKHSKMIALVESQPQFWIKRKKLHRIAEEAPAYQAAPIEPEKQTAVPSAPAAPATPPQPAVNPLDKTDYLDKLQAEDYL